MCKLCTIRELTGSAGDAYSSGFDFSSAGQMAGDPFLAALAPIAIKAAGKLLSRKSGGPGIGGMTGITQMKAGIGAIQQYARGGGMTGAVGAFRRSMTGGRGAAPPPIASGLPPGVAPGPRARVTPIAGGFRHRARGRGISARELRGFRKVTNLLRRVGMVPRGLGHTRRRRR